VLTPVVVLVLNDAADPAGRPVAVKLTAPLKPLRSVTAIVVLALPAAPPTILRLPDVDDREKSGVATVSATVVVCVRLPEVPVMVMLDSPAVAVLATVKVRTLVLVVLDGLNDAVTPAGKPVTPRTTDPLKPLIPATVTVLLPLVPATTLRLLGEADNE
jgi:hypothetical protein